MTTQSRTNPIQVEARLATPDDANLAMFDHTRLSAINTCPMWGIVRYTLHKKMRESSRAMALEAGSASHEVFAAVRLLDLYENQLVNRPFGFELFQFHGLRLFGQRRFDMMLERYKAMSGEDERTRIMNFALTALETGEFYDDPRDKRRTMANIEESCIAYIDRWPWGKQPIWIRDPSNPKSDVGIEVPLDIVMSITIDGETVTFRFVGKMDGLHWNSLQTKLVIGENKTASRLDEAWAESFTLSHQVTGYCFAASIWSGALVQDAAVTGMAIPLPRTLDSGGIRRVSTTRDVFMFEQWLRWMFHTIRLHDQYVNDVVNAPKYTHSCNRYFRPCALVPFCATPDEDKLVFLEDMVVDRWSPLDDEGKSGD